MNTQEIALFPQDVRFQFVQQLVDCIHEYEEYEETGGNIASAEELYSFAQMLGIEVSERECAIAWKLSQSV